MEAETSSAEAEDCSATVATSTTSVWMRPVPAEICSTAAAISSTRAVTSTTAASMLANAARDCSTVRAPASVRAAPLSTTLDDAGGLVADLADQRGDRAGGGLGALGELAHLVGDDGEAAALLAGAGGLDRGVQREQVGLLGQRGDRLDDRLDLLGARGEVADRGGDLVGGGLHAGHRLEGVLRGRRRRRGRRRGPRRRRGRPRGPARRSAGGDRGGLLGGVAHDLDAARLALGAGRDGTDGVGDLGRGGARSPARWRPCGARPRRRSAEEPATSPIIVASLTRMPL